jgi:hypothetical protein
MLLKAISYCREQGNQDLLQNLDIISFFLKSETAQQYGFMSLRRRIFAYWIKHKLADDLTETEK